MSLNSLREQTWVDGFKFSKTVFGNDNSVIRLRLFSGCHRVLYVCLLCLLAMVPFIITWKNWNRCFMDLIYHKVIYSKFFLYRRLTISIEMEKDTTIKRHLVANILPSKTKILPKLLYVSNISYRKDTRGVTNDVKKSYQYLLKRNYFTSYNQIVLNH